MILRTPESAIRWLTLFLLILFPAWNLLLLLKTKSIIASTCRTHHGNRELLLHIWLWLMVVVHQYFIRLLAIYDIMCLERETSWVRIQILGKCCHWHCTLLPHMLLDIGLLRWKLLQMLVSWRWTLVLAVQNSQSLIVSKILWLVVYILRKNCGIIVNKILLLLQARGSKLWVVPNTRNISLLLLLSETCLWRNHPSETATGSRCQLFLMKKAVLQGCTTVIVISVSVYWIQWIFWVLLWDSCLIVIGWRGVTLIRYHMRLFLFEV